ncbi:hypothetical protein NTE_00417 [Candidatus Nitrososphaera evergladensis SR1]|uniref:Uncharacterized protein n=1 Tax=Candidatus Nitrososphaera evergladensis SR1 TaxID=1459636 RepID=A0A075MT52_9ARCH|nr:hypothetical protein [Candidatus Nitrososphaera evergladensis]AIF82499.1 hypothetical protein NTE_00417 [Candidatus Nitrososphaera evergladensis SR1]
MLNKKASTIAVLVTSMLLIGILASVPPSNNAVAEEEKQDDNNNNDDGAIHTRVFITKPSCTDKSAWELQQSITLNKYGYYSYTNNSSLDVVCFPHVSLLTLDRTVEKARVAYPKDMLIFVYDLSSPRAASNNNSKNAQTSLVSDQWEWNLWLRLYSNIPSTFDYSLLLGKAWIDKGYAVADYNSEVINHEWAHLATCKIHGPNTDEGNPATWQPFFAQNETRPWCTS